MARHDESKRHEQAISRSADARRASQFVADRCQSVATKAASDDRISQVFNPLTRIEELQIRGDVPLGPTSTIVRRR
jgi:hypothetical protein